ncbi:type VI secretion system protein TssA [Roseiconus lacunae]|uniref:type VI secretion system protein TssA n=1 Tax=Roseiconus lacunae TaxID=2605694 RepID=UPI00135B1AB2|nr:type VI secretion system protein TssA [Roseiconus lacunae]
MASEPTLDFDALLAPISDDTPAGEYLRRSDFERFQNAKDARNEAVGAERKMREFALFSEADLAELDAQGQGVESPSPPDWRTVHRQCTEILASHSKDLWVATWLIEANTRLHGIVGARDGFKYVSEMCEQYWDGINPPFDEDEGYAETVSQLTSLNGMEGPGTLIAPLEEVELVPGYGALTFVAYREATERGGGETTEGDFLNAVRQVDLETLRSHEEDIAEAIAEYSRMCGILESKCQSDEHEDCTPPSSQIRRALEALQQSFATLTRNLLSDGGGEVAAGGSDEGSPTGIASPSAPSVDIAQAQVNNREDAFRMLMKASEFFRKTEPHSPVSYMLQQAVEFGRMDLPTLLQTLIRDDDVLKNFSERVGVPVKEDSYDDD